MTTQAPGSVGPSGEQGAGLIVSRAEQFAVLPAAVSTRWLRYGQWEREFFPGLLGLRVEEVRIDYCRMRLGFRPALEQPAGVVHGGAWEVQPQT